MPTINGYVGMENYFVFFFPRFGICFGFAWRCVLFACSIAATGVFLGFHSFSRILNVFWVFSMLFTGFLPFFNGVILQMFYVFLQFMCVFHSVFTCFHWLFQSVHCFLHGVHCFSRCFHGFLEIHAVQTKNCRCIEGCIEVRMHD